MLQRLCLVCCALVCLELAALMLCLPLYSADRLAVPAMGWKPFGPLGAAMGLIDPPCAPLPSMQRVINPVSCWRIIQLCISKYR